MLRFGILAKTPSHSSSPLPALSLAPVLVAPLLDQAEEGMVNPSGLLLLSKLGLAFGCGSPGLSFRLDFFERRCQLVFVVFRVQDLGLLFAVACLEGRSS